MELILYAGILGIFVGLAAGFVGSIMVLEKMALVGDALSHVALPGLALGILFHFNPLIGAFVFLFGSAAMIWQLGRMTRLSFDTLVGTIFTLALAIGILLVPEPDLLEALFGNISTIDIPDTIIGIIISIIVIFLTWKIYRQIILSLISEELAISSGIKVTRINLLYLLLVSLVVAIGIQFTGTLLVGFMVITPAAAAKMISPNLKRYCLLSAIFGGLSAFLGLLLAFYLDVYRLLSLPPGPIVVICGVGIFFIAIIIRQRMKFA